MAILSTKIAGPDDPIYKSGLTLMSSNKQKEHKKDILRPGALNNEEKRIFDLSLFREQLPEYYKNENSITLITRPNLYDYFHEMTIYDDGTIEFESGGTQRVYGRAIGKVEIKNIYVDDEMTHIILQFKNISLLHPYKDIVFDTIEPFVCDIYKWGGINQNKFYRIYEIPYEEEYRVYHTMYEVANDPLAIFRNNYFKYSDEFYQPENGGIANMTFNSSVNLFLNQEDYTKIKKDEVGSKGYNMDMLNKNHALTMDE